MLVKKDSVSKWHRNARVASLELKIQRKLTSIGDGGVICSSRLPMIAYQLSKLCRRASELRLGNVTCRIAAAHVGTAESDTLASIY
jgi:hypothetical protein